MEGLSTIAELEAELDALLAPMPEAGTLRGRELKKFNKLVLRIGLGQAKEMAEAAGAEADAALAELAKEQAQTFRKMLGGLR